MIFAAGIEYCGTLYSGWQRQKHSESVQQHVEHALSIVANHPVTVKCAGRTDAGVHALHQVIHFEAPVERESRSWVMGCNANLPDDISVLWAIPVDDSFHARFTALSRYYRYIILNRATRPSISQGYVSWSYRKLDIKPMYLAAQQLVGKHDFTSFRTQRCQSKSPVRDVTSLEVERIGEYVIIHIKANAFLHHMVRNIAGVLMEIGHGDRQAAWAGEVLEARKREAGGVTASPHGLYLMDIEYPEHFAIPGREGPSWPILDAVKP